MIGTTAELASARRRFAALLLDMMVLVLLAVTAASLFRATDYSPPDDVGAEFVAVSISVVIAAGVTAGLLIVAACWGILAGTPGLLLMGCRIVDVEDGGRLGLGRGVIRFVGMLLAFAPFAIGLLWMLWDHRRQGWHDKLAGSLVIVEDEARMDLNTLAGGVG